MESFPMTIKMVNDELAKQTWARKTWQERVYEATSLHVNPSTKHNTYYILFSLRGKERKRLKVRTLCQSDGVCVEDTRTFIF